MTLSQTLQEDYDAVVAAFHPSENCEDGGLSEADILKAHYILSDYFLKKGEAVRYGVLNFDMLSSAVNRQFVGFGGQVKWKDPFCKMATLTFGLTMDHAFHDGNKRTALLSLLLYLNNHKRVVNVPKIELETLMVRIAAHQLYLYDEFRDFNGKDDAEVRFIANRVRAWTRPVNNRLYTITYSDLNTRLRDFGFWIDKPSGNSIGVYRKSSVLGIPKRVCKIGFPGWSKQISDKDLKYLLQMTQLTATYGCDSDVFFRFAQPTYELLEEYREPLERLKDQ